MRSLEPFFSIGVVHDYYEVSDPPANGSKPVVPIQFTPIQETARMISNSGLHLKYDQGRVDVFAPSDRADLKNSAQDEYLSFAFDLKTDDPNLENVTAKIVGADKQPLDFVYSVLEGDSETEALVFESRYQVIQKAKQSERLVDALGVDGAPVSLQDLAHKIDVPEASIPQLLAGLRALGGEFTLDTQGIVLTRPSTSSSILDAARGFLGTLSIAIAPSQKGAAYQLKLGSTERFWAYNIIGGAADTRYDIRDTTGRNPFKAITFSQVDQASENAQRNKMRFVSDQAILDRSQSEASFQLITQDASGPRIVISTLPNASSEIGSLQTVGTETRLNAEIYVSLW